MANLNECNSCSNREHCFTYPLVTEFQPILQGRAEDLALHRDEFVPDLHEAVDGVVESTNGVLETIGHAVGECQKLSENGRLAFQQLAGEACVGMVYRTRNAIQGLETARNATSSDVE